MGDDWVHAAEVERRLRGEAEAIAKRLGHRIEAWHQFGERFRARCLNCFEYVWLAPRKFREAAMHGVPVSLACRPGTRR